MAPRKLSFHPLNQRLIELVVHKAQCLAEIHVRDCVVFCRAEYLTCKDVLEMAEVIMLYL